MMWDYGPGAWWMWAQGLVVPLLVGAAVVLLAMLLVRAGSPPERRTGQGDAARTILEERLARGELTTEQFREMLGAIAEGRQR
jgi:putative membrane protein